MNSNSCSIETPQRTNILNMYQNDDLIRLQWRFENLLESAEEPEPLFFWGDGRISYGMQTHGQSFNFFPYP